MTNEFIETFGYHENNVEENENIKYVLVRLFIRTIPQVCVRLFCL